MQSLAQFHFDPKKSGAILKKWIKESGFTYHQIAEMTGIPYDTLNNSLQGRVQDLSLERAFKVAVCTGHSTCEYIKLMLQDEDIDFRHRVHVLRDVPMERALFVDHPDDCCASIPKETAISLVPPPQEIPAIPAVVSDSPAFGLDERAMEAIRMDRERHDRYTECLVEQYKDQIQQLKDSREITISHYEERISLLIQEHEKRVTDIKEAHARATAFLKDEHKRLEKWVIILGVALGVETAAVIVIFMVDALNRNVGWFRGLLPYVGDGVFDALKS